MGGKDELFKTTARTMPGQMPWPVGGLTEEGVVAHAQHSSPLPACGRVRGEGEGAASVFAHDGRGGLG